MLSMVVIAVALLGLGFIVIRGLFIREERPRSLEFLKSFWGFVVAGAVIVLYACIVFHLLPVPYITPADR